MTRLTSLTTFALFLTATTQANAQQPDVPKGEVTKYTFNSSKIFPGTVRDYWLYVPMQYDPAKPACVHVNQDGIQFNAPAVFDELIHKKEMPVTIGVFIMHGRVKAPDDKSLDRFNRSFEYDGLGDNYVRFLLDELLPDVETKKTSDGRPIKLSESGNDRSIGGSSSGAICAFTAAWERPNAFSRVFSAIGTYVGLRGGNNYPTLIRKYEPKPIRVFLQDGSGDLDIYGGDWWMANQEMERALKFAGYEVNHEWGAGGHDSKHAAKIFPEAMKWLWKDWPTPVKAGLGSKEMKEILKEGEGWKPIAGPFSALAALTVNGKGEVHFEYHGKEPGYYRIGQDLKPEFIDDNHRNNAYLAFGPGNKLYTRKTLEQIQVTEPNEEIKPFVKDLYPFCLVALHDGKFYCIGEDQEKPWGFSMFFINSKGEKRALEEIPLEQPISRASIAVSPDQTLLYLADPLSHWVYAYQIQKDGSLKHKQKFYHLHVPDDADNSGALAMCVDRDGRLYVATRMGIQVCDQTGRVNCIIPAPGGQPTAICFGGANFDTLFVNCGDRIYTRKLKTRGANAFEPPTKPAQPRL
ncbi:MAG TPA: SMP-30/gluconolactonase/LRE family protein [Gemmataceae bacterium]|nr:SMP-30/gluconolactonase/LRE family protein [Gemmataceae bacterium]